MSSLIQQIFSLWLMYAKYMASFGNIAVEIRKWKGVEAYDGQVNRSLADL